MQTSLLCCLESNPGDQINAVEMCSIPPGSIAPGDCKVPFCLNDPKRECCLRSNRRWVGRAHSSGFPDQTFQRNGGRRKTPPSQRERQSSESASWKGTDCLIAADLTRTIGFQQSDFHFAISLRPQALSPQSTGLLRGLSEPLRSARSGKPGGKLHFLWKCRRAKGAKGMDVQRTAFFWKRLL